MQDDADKSLDELSHEQVVLRYRDGDEKAFEMLVRRFRPELFHFLLRFVNNRAAAEDLFQETFLQVHLSIDTFDTTRNFKPWLFTIAANKARDYLRRNSRQRAAPLSALVNANQDNGRTFVDLLEADLPLPMEDLEKQETRELVQEVVDALPDHLREVLLLAYFNHFAYKEIAAMLSIPLGTVKSRLHAAVGTFAELWKSRFDARQQELGNGGGGDVKPGQDQG
ncbi:RNA polymerase sigma factor [Phycisphaerales bacterium AB-hyl4]|uniref:RNA polymerase sigma factor n=1 Tax=Natronomicrosphaera hydrolytica TaxID=3242702 RepID=A0ABV4U8K8_9BACT